MPKPRTTAPRASLVHPELFGRPGAVEWVQPASADEYASLRAAELQHHVALEIKDRLQAADYTSAWLEERAGIAGGRVGKLLRGHAQMTLRDLQAVEGQLGAILTKLRFARVRVTDPSLRARFPADSPRWGADSG